MEEVFQIGIVTGPHGLKGEVKVYPTTDDVRRFKKLNDCFLETKQGRLELEAVSCKILKKHVVLKFKDMDDINQAERYKGCGIYVTRDQAVKLSKDEYYIADLIGAVVEDEEHHILGHLESVLPTGANDVYIVRTGENKELLLPAIKQCIKDVNVKEKKITVHLLEGLMS